MDLKSIINSTRHYNFHSHTEFCDGRDTIADMVRAAVANGFLHYGFSPHSPIAIPSPCNMQAADMDAYRAEVEKAQAAAGDKCKFYVGMEIDFLDRDRGPAGDYFKSLDLDYSIGSVHFIPNQKGEYVDIDGRFENFRKKMGEFFNNDIEYVVKKFYEQSSEMLSAGGFDILGHFDKIGQNASYFKPGIEDEAWYQAIVNDYIEQIVESGLIVEINTKAREEHGRFFPGERYWQRLIDSGVQLMINSDAHYAARVNASRDEAFQLLENLGYGK